MMIKGRNVLVALFAAMSFVLISCGSTPEPDDSAETSEELVDETQGALWSKVEESRKAAIDAGAETASPQAFKAAEEAYNALKKESAGKSEDEQAESLRELDSRYQALKAYAEAAEKKARIDELNFSSYNRAAYKEGSDLMDELQNSEDYGPEWNKKALAANEKLGAVLTAAYKSLSQEERTEAFKAKRQADSIKCAVSRKAEYDKYVSNFKAGDQNYVTGNPEGALNNYTNVKEGFTALYSEVSEARRKAQEAIDEAKRRVSESESTAQWADKEKPLGNEPVEGIEAEGTTLLEADNFADAEAAEVEVDEILDVTILEAN